MIGKKHGSIRAVTGFELGWHEGDGGRFGSRFEAAIDELRHGGLSPLLIAVGGSEVGECIDAVLIEQLELDYVVVAGLLQKGSDDLIRRDGQQHGAILSHEGEVTCFNSPSHKRSVSDGYLNDVEVLDMWRQRREHDGDSVFRKRFIFESVRFKLDRQIALSSSKGGIARGRRRGLCIGLPSWHRSGHRRSL